MRLQVVAYAALGNSCREDCFRLTFLSLDLRRSPLSSFSTKSSIDLKILSDPVEIVMVVPLSSRCPLATNSFSWDEDFADLSNSMRARMIFSSCLKIFSILDETTSLCASVRER